MSMYFIKHGKLEVRVPGKSMTKQAFKDDTDINKLLARGNKIGALSHLDKHEGMYGDFAEFDFLDAQLQLSRGREVFDELPVELKREFQQEPRQFFEFVNDPVNKDRLKEIFPVLAEPGSYALDVSGRQPPGASMDPDAPDVDAGVPPPATPPEEGA